MTIADHVAQAEKDLEALHDRGALSPAFQNRALSAIAHSLTALALLLSGQERPGIPGLPDGYELLTRQTGNGNCKWRYELAGPSMAYASRYRYDTSDTALTAGLQHARTHARPPELHDGPSLLDDSNPEG